MKRLDCMKVNGLKASIFIGAAFSVFTTVAQAFPGQASPICLHSDSKSCSVALEQNSLNRNHKELIDEVWQSVNRSYIDATFNGHNWQAVRQQYLAGSYASKADAYKAIKKMLQLLGDRYTRFMSPEEFRGAQRSTSGEPGNIGLRLGQDKQTNQLFVALGSVESPAFQSGLLPGDVVLSIDGQTTQNMYLYDAIGLLPGSAGTRVVLEVKRGQQNLTFTVNRSTQKSPSLYSSSQTTEFGKVAYIHLLDFAADSSGATRTAIRNFENEQVAGYILDLRANPGGLLYAGVEIAQMWLQGGTIFSTTSRSGEDHKQARQNALTNKPLIVIVDGQSAAASEILASALQENKRAMLVGTPTYGQNSIQTVRSLGDGAGLAVTIAKWLTSKGRDIEKTGVVPDVVVKLTQTQQQNLIRQRSLGTAADPQYAKALQRLSQQIKGST